MEDSERLGLIERDTVEILTREELENLVKSEKTLKAYIGRATTGPLHLGHVITLSKMVDLQKANVDVIILIADVHAALDDLKAKWEDLALRVEYTTRSIELAIKWIKKPTIIKGSDFQLSRDYIYDVLRASSITTIDRAIRAASEVTRMKNPKVSELIYPIMQALDEQYLDVDIQVGGIDQRHIMAFARELLPVLGYKKRIEVMTPLIPSLLGPNKKMSSSEPETLIKVNDSPESIKTKLLSAYCPEGVVDGNPIMALYRYLIFPNYGKIKIEREPRFGGDIEFNSYEEMERQYLERKLHPLDIKNALAKYIIDLFKDVRSYWEQHRDLLEKLGPQFL